MCTALQDPEVGGVPDEAYVKDTPSMITVQGQNRAAIAISVFAQDFGLSKDRAGREGGTELFSGGSEGEQQPGRSKENEHPRTQGVKLSVQASWPRHLRVRRWGSARRGGCTTRTHGFAPPPDTRLLLFGYPFSVVSQTGNRAMKLEELRKSLSAAGASFRATVFDFLSYKAASTKGRQSHLHEANSRVSERRTILFLSEAGRKSAFSASLRESVRLQRLLIVQTNVRHGATLANSAHTRE